MTKLFLLCLAGISGGILGGMGMGGGTLLIPMLTVWFDIPQKLAQAMNLLSFISMAVVALIMHAKNKLVNIKGIKLLIIFAIVFSIGGSFLVTYVSGDLQTKLYGAFLICLAIVKFCASIKKELSKKRTS